MEKYRKFADPGTGINPFIPSHFTKTRRLDHYISSFRSTVLICLLILKLPLFILWIPLCIISDILFMVPVVSSILIRPILRPVVSVISLWLLGVYPTPIVIVEDFRRLKSRRPQHDKIQYGMYTFAPFYGFIDILVHSLVTKPTAFVFPTGSGHLVTYRSVLGALWAAMNAPIQAHSTTTEAPPLQSLVFLHSAPSNGQVILKIQTDRLRQVGRNFQVFKINYYDQSYGAHHTVGSVLLHVFNLMTKSWYIGVKVYGLPEPIVDDLNLIGPMLSRLSEPNLETQIDESTYSDFRKYWNETQRYVK
jgi:hypothetical protein